MSTIDQAFVQAFARRNRGPSTTTQTLAPKERTQVSPPTGSEPDSAIQWVDPAKDSLLRSEAAANRSVPPPHIQSTSVSPEVNGDLGQPSSGTVGTTAETAAGSQSTLPSSAEPPYISASSQKKVSFRTSSAVADRSEPMLLQPNQKDRTATDRRVETKSFGADSPTSEPVPQHRIDAVEAIANAPHIDAKIDAKLEPQSAPIKASWEVDVFDIPTSVMDLFFKDELFQTVAERLNIAVSEGLSSMMVTSSKPGEGRSTVAIGMAVAAAATGIRVALVDGDVDEPTLVDDLRLDVDHGWRDAIHSGMPLSQVAVYSIEDNLTLFPLAPSTADSTAAIKHDLREMVQSLSQQFDLIIIDAGSGNGEAVDQLATLVDSAVIARDASRTDAATINELSSRLRGIGLQGIGIVENFA